MCALTFDNQEKEDQGVEVTFTERDELSVNSNVQDMIVDDDSHDDDDNKVCDDAYGDPLTPRSRSSVTMAVNVSLCVNILLLMSKVFLLLLGVCVS